MSISDNINHLRDEIAIAAKRADRTVDDITLVCVTKFASVDQIKEAASCGITDFGENRVQSAIEKIGQIQDRPLRWHMVGHLQTNKVRDSVKFFDLIQSVDSLRLSECINKECQRQNSQKEIFIQVNTQFAGLKTI